MSVEFRYKTAIPCFVRQITAPCLMLGSSCGSCPALQEGLSSCFGPVDFIEALDSKLYCTGHSAGSGSVKGRYGIYCSVLLLNTPAIYNSWVEILFSFGAGEPGIAVRTVSMNTSSWQISSVFVRTGASQWEQLQNTRPLLTFSFFVLIIIFIERGILTIVAQSGHVFCSLMSWWNMLCEFLSTLVFTLQVVMHYGLKPRPSSSFVQQ